MIEDFIFKIGNDDVRRVETAKGQELSIRCPICGDSKKDRKKKRFYYNLDKNSFWCFNCHEKGGIKTLINHFPAVEGVDYTKLSRYIEDKVIMDFIDTKGRRKNDSDGKKRAYDLEFPEGSLLDIACDERFALSKPYKDSLIKVLKYLKGRGIKPAWYSYFWLPFPDTKFQNYILTLFEHDGDWVWSGRKVWGEGPKYKHLKDFPFHIGLGFSENVNSVKGKDLYIVEGWFDSLILNQEGYNSVCVFGQQNMKYNHSSLDRFRSDYNLVWIPDNDNSMDEFLRINKNFSEKMEIKILKEKDVNEMYISCSDFKGIFDDMKIFTISNYKLLRDIEIIF